MTEFAEALRSVAFAALMVTSLLAIAGVGSTAPGDPTTYAVTQGDACYEVSPLGDGTQSVSDFYDYQSGQGTLFGSYGTTHFQENQVSQLFLFNGSEGTSLVMLHDKLEDGPNASVITFNVSGLPETREWAVEDDDYDGQDDVFNHSGTESTIHWFWAKHRTDGAAVRGLEDTANYSAVEIEPGFNENATYWGQWPYARDDDNKTQAWKFLTGPGENATTPAGKVELDMTENVTIEAGSCPDTQDPEADLTGPAAVEEGAQVTLDASDSTDDEGIVSYEWDFGDGNTTTTTSPTADHTYETNGTYTASVTVSDDAGNTDTATHEITVTEPDDEPPAADLVTTPSQAEVGQDEVTFDASGSTDNGEIVEYRWDFDGDGTVDETTSADSTTHTYDSTGEFDAAVTVVDASGNEDTANATVNVSDTTDPVASADVPDSVVVDTTFEVDGSESTDDGEIVSYEWDFGDGNASSGETTSHSYAENGTYTVTLTVTDEAGNSNSTTAEVTVTDEDTQDPTAALDAPDEVEPGETVSLDASGSSDDGEIVRYEWDFGDGNSTNTTDPTTSHAYDSEDDYDVTVTVVDGAGNTDTATKTVTVAESSGGDPPSEKEPTADFEWSRTSTDEKIKFDASNSFDEDGDIVRYNWSFDNSSGWHQSGEVVHHEYSKFGTFDVTLEVTDDDGNTDTVTREVEVTDRTEPEGDVDAPKTVEVGESFTAKAVDLDDDSDIVHVCWFVDGDPVGDDLQKALDWTFDETGEHTLELRVEDEYGNVHSVTHTVEVVARSSGGGGGGGGGGGNGNTGNTGDAGEDTRSNVDDSGDRVTIDVTNAKGEEPLTVELPTGVEAGDGVPAYDALTVTLTHDGDYDLTLDASVEAPEGIDAPTVESVGFESLSYLTLEHPEVSDEEIADAAFTFTIQQDRLDALDADADDVRIYRHDDGEWVAIETTVVEETDGNVTFRAGDSGLSTFVVAVDRPLVSTTDLAASTTDVSPGESVDFTATLANDGRADDVVTVEFAVDGETVDERTMTVGADDDRRITFSRTFGEPGTYTVSVNGQEVEVVVQDEETATPGPTPTATATATPSPTATTSEGQPGFGITLAVFALVGAALLASRRR